MEHRETPPIGADRTASRTVEALALPAPDRRPAWRPATDRPRVAIAAALLAAIILGSYLGYRTIRAAVDWLGDQPAYRIPFREIRLEPPPPAWYRGGSDAFLDDVRRRTRMPERFSLLNVKEDELWGVFESSPWVVEVRKITYRPLGVTVELIYRRPVALVDVSPNEGYVIDESAHILPREAIEPLDERFPLVVIKGKGLTGPLDPRPGIPWKPRAGTVDLAPGNGRIPSAARLADFLGTKFRAIPAASDPARRWRHINPMDYPTSYRGLFLWSHEDETYILWGEAPGEEKDGEPAAEEKWARILAWSRSATRHRLPDGNYWKFAATGVVPAWGERRSPSAARTPRPTRDQEAILAKDPG